MRPHPRHLKRRPAALALSLTLLGSLALGVVATPANAAPTPVRANADTYTVSTLPTQTNGSNTKIAVGTSSGTRVGYLAFPSSTLTSASQVKLKLTVDGGTSGTLRVLQLNDSWKEASTTHKNAPKLGSLLGTIKVAAGKQVVEAAIPRPQATGSTISIALQRTDGGITRISSREAGSAMAPSMTAVAAAVAAPAAPSTPSTCTVSAKLVPSCGAWLGASANPLGS